MFSVSSNQMLSSTLTHKHQLYFLYFSHHIPFIMRLIKRSIFICQPFRLFSPFHATFNKCKERVCVCVAWKATRLNEPHKIANFERGHGAPIKIGAQILDWTTRNF